MQNNIDTVFNVQQLNKLNLRQTSAEARIVKLKKLKIEFIENNYCTFK